MLLEELEPLGRNAEMIADEARPADVDLAQVDADGAACPPLEQAVGEPPLGAPGRIAVAPSPAAARAWRAGSSISSRRVW